jgi:hypothetical protein
MGERRVKAHVFTLSTPLALKTYKHLYDEPHNLLPPFRPSAAVVKELPAASLCRVESVWRRPAGMINRVAASTYQKGGRQPRTNHTVIRLVYVLAGCFTRYDNVGRINVTSQRARNNVDYTDTTDGETEADSSIPSPSGGGETNHGATQSSSEFTSHQFYPLSSLDFHFTHVLSLGLHIHASASWRYAGVESMSQSSTSFVISSLRLYLKFLS